MNRKSNPVSEFIERNMFISLISIVVSAVGITYLVIDKLILTHYKLKIEDKEIRILELEKSNKEKERLIDSFKLKLKSIKTDTTIIIIPPDTRITEIDKLINEGEKLRKEFDSSDSLSKYSNWYNRCILLMSTVDSAQEQVNRFKNSVIINESNYPMIPRMINVGTEILSEVKGKLKSE
jgi:hypothetical protein